MDKKNVLQEAEEIIFQRSQEKERDYGPIDESMEKAGIIATMMTGKEITAKDMYMCIIALKLSRLSHEYKRDNYVDAAAYIGALASYEAKVAEQIKLINDVFPDDKN